MITPLSEAAIGGDRLPLNRVLPRRERRGEGSPQNIGLDEGGDPRHVLKEASGNGERASRDEQLGEGER